MNKAIFIDKDGTLIKDIPYNINSEKICLTRGAGNFLSCLSGQGYKIIVVTNQSGIARGYFSEKEMPPLMEKIRQLLASFKVVLDGFYYCPHHPKGKILAYRKICDCRKPKPGLLLKAASDLNLDLEECWMIGDILDDVEAGNRAGCRTILYAKNNDEISDNNRMRMPDFKSFSFGEMQKIIKKESWRSIMVSKI